MTREDQNKILDAKIESNVNQYKVDRMNAEISAFSSGDLNKYEFLKRIDLNYKPNALDKARFEFFPLARTFNEGLDKTIPNYQEEGVMKLLKEIRDNLAAVINIPAGLVILPGPPSAPSLLPSSPGSPSLPPSSPGSPSLTNVTPLSPPGSPQGPSRKLKTVRPRPKISLSDAQKLLDQLKLEASQRPKSPPVIPIMSKISISKRSQSNDLDERNKKYDFKKHNQELDDIMKELDERNKKQDQDELSELLEKKEMN